VVDDFKAKLLATGVGDSQTRQALAVLSGMFTYAEQRGRIAKNPVRLVRKPSNRRKRAVVCLPPLTVELARAMLLEDERYGDAALVCVLAYAGPRPQDALALEWSHVRERTLLFEQKNVDGEIVAGQKTGRPPRTTPLWAPLRDDLVAWQLRSGRRRGLVFPNYKGEPWSETDWGNWTVRVRRGLREQLGVSEPPLRIAALLRVAADPGGSVDPGAGGGARPQPADDPWHVRARDPRAARRPPAARPARDRPGREEVAERGLERLVREAIR
jgi:integrase